MDKKKTLKSLLLLMGVLLMFSQNTSSQTPAKLKVCERSYNYGIGSDSVKVCFNVTDGEGKRIQSISPEKFNETVAFYIDGLKIQNPTVRMLSSGIRIPRDYTFSILLDKNIPVAGKEQIMESIKKFVSIAPDSCVYISFYGDMVSNTRMVNSGNIAAIESEFLEHADGKSFYSGVYSKLAEFSKKSHESISDIKATDYEANPLIAQRAGDNPHKNYLMVFAEGSRRPDDEAIEFFTITDYQELNSEELPVVYGFYYTADGENTYIEDTLLGLAHPKDRNHKPISELAGAVKPSANMSAVLNSFNEVIADATYDYELFFKADPEKRYSGNVTFSANWGNIDLGSEIFSIGSAERPWPERELSAGSVFIEIGVALLVTILTFAFFFIVMKVVVPYFQSLAFKSKYYKKYQPEANIQRRICHYCKQDIRPGQVIVTKCNHYMHKHCWEENGYKCAEFGQNCKTGIQKHIDWREVFSLASIKDCSQTIAGILAGLISWIIYEASGRGGFESISKFIVRSVFSDDSAQSFLIGDCVARTSSFLMIGLLLGFFLSVVFRYKDDIRDKNWKIWAKIIGLSLLTGVIGMVAFGIGADLFCLILYWTGKTYIPWYCSLPAYILFSISVSLTLTIKSSIPVRSALLGGLASSVIGFLVLYFTKFSSGKYEWLSMLLDFIIYGGGLGASLVTVRMLAEKYFLVIQNGIKAGQRIPIHKWMSATGGGNKVSIGMTGECEIQMNWEKSNKVAKEHAQLYIDHEKNLPVIKPLATGIQYNSRAELPVNRPSVLSNGDTFRIGETIFKYEEA